MNQNEKRAAFKMPENYFDDFPLAMMDVIATEEQPKKSSRFFRSAWTYAVAAMFVGVLFLGQYFLSSNMKSNGFIESYDSYVLSQVDESALLDFYFVADNDD